jgi:hypothetical protein
MAEVRFVVGGAVPEGLVNIFGGNTDVLTFVEDPEGTFTASDFLASQTAAHFFLHVVAAPTTAVTAKITVSGSNIVRPRSYRVPSDGQLAVPIPFIVP